MNSQTANLDDLIAKSSIGAGLANIRENGIEAELAVLEDELRRYPDALVIPDDAPEAEEAAPTKKRKKSTSPTARTLAECKRRGWIAGVVERHIPFPRPQGTKIDLFGVIDLVVIVPPFDRDGNGWPEPGGILAIQATGGQGGVHAARRAKILAEPRAKAWIDAGGRLELWSWSKRGAAGKRKTWALRVETYEEMLASREGSP